MNDSELRVLRAFYEAVGAELDNWVDGASVRVLSRAHAMLACAVEQPVSEPEPEQGNTITPVEDCWRGTWVCPHTGQQHLWVRGRSGECGWCGLKSDIDGVSENPAVPRRVPEPKSSTEYECPEGGVHRWEYGDDGHGHSGEVCTKCGLPEQEYGWTSAGITKHCPRDEHQWSDNGSGLMSCDVCPAVR